MALGASNQVLRNVWSYDFYDMALATESQRRNMINSKVNNYPITKNKPINYVEA